MQADLVVFDCDGVLVDSEAVVIRIEAAMLSEADFPITADEIAGAGADVIIDHPRKIAEHL